MVEEPAFDRQAVAEAAEGAVGAEDPVAGDEQGGGIAGAGIGGGAGGGGAAGDGGEFGVGDGSTGRDLAQDLPGVGEEGPESWRTVMASMAVRSPSW